MCCVCVVLKKKSASNHIRSKYFRSVVSGLYVPRLWVVMLQCLMVMVLVQMKDLKQILELLKMH